MTVGILSVVLVLVIVVAIRQMWVVARLRNSLASSRHRINLIESGKEAWEKTAREILGVVLSRESTADIVREMGEALAKNLVGWGQPANNTNEKIDAMSMGAMGYDGMGGVRAGDWYPEVEFDENMEAATKWPTRGGWVGKQDSQTQEPATEPSPNGAQERMTFRSGQTGPSPTEGFE